MAFVDEVDTLFHMVIADWPTLLIAPIAARKMSASISPYSTAVAALVDRSSLAILVIVPAPACDRISAPALHAALFPARWAVRDRSRRACAR